MAARRNKSNKKDKGDTNKPARADEAGFEIPGESDSVLQLSFKPFRKREAGIAADGRGEETGNRLRLGCQPDLRYRRTRQPACRTPAPQSGTKPAKGASGHAATAGSVHVAGNAAVAACPSRIDRLRNENKILVSSGKIQTISNTVLRNLSI